MLGLVLVTRQFLDGQRRQLKHLRKEALELRAELDEERDKNRRREDELLDRVLLAVGTYSRRTSEAGEPPLPGVPATPASPSDLGDRVKTALASQAEGTLASDRAAAIAEDLKSMRRVDTDNELDEPDDEDDA